MFVGRDSEIASLLEILESTRLKSRSGERLLLLLGASGSGKSSLVRAGVLPRLRRLPERWQLLPPMRPGLDPLRELALCLAAVLRQDLEAVASRLAAAGRDGGPLQVLTDEIRLQAGQPEAAVLLVLDQMEELLGVSEAQACGRFLDVLRRALEHGDGRFLVLATLRSEYLGEVQLLPFLTTPGPLPYREQTLDPVPLDRLDDIIRMPGQRWPQPVEFADRLVERMIRDTGTRDALPLLAFTLNRLWRDTAARADGVFQFEEYWRLGGLEGSVRTAADEALLRRRTPAELEALRTAFVPGLVRVDAEGVRTRRRAFLTDLTRATRVLLDPFVDLGLLVTNREPEGRETIEVAHEALLRTWPHLDTWLKEDQDALRLLDGLERAARDWEDEGRSPDLLAHRGARLAEMQNLLGQARFRQVIGDPERRYLEANTQAEAEREAREREERERRVTDAERIAEERKKAAEAQKNIARRTQIGLVAVLLVAGLAVWQYFEATTELRRAVETDGRRLAQIAGRYLQEGRPHQAIMVAREAFGPLKEDLPFQERPYVWQAADVLHRALAARPFLRKIFRGHKWVVNMAAFSHDGKHIVTAGTDGRMFVLNAQTLEVERLLIPNRGTLGENAHKPGENVYWAAFSPDGEHLATANEDGTGRIFGVRDGKQVVQFHAHPGAAGSLSFTLGDSILLNTPDDIPQARLCNTADGTLVRNIIDKAGCCLLQRVVSPDGRRIAVVEADGVAVWDARSGHRLMRSGFLPWHEALSVAFSPDGSRLATGHQDSLARVWDIQSGKEVLTLRGHEAEMVGSVAFSPDGRHILTTGCCVYAEALVWDARSGARVASLLGHEAQEGLRGVRSAAFSPDGRYIVTAGQDHTVRLWEFAPPVPVRTLKNDKGSTYAFTFSPDGSSIAACTNAAALLVWRLDEGEPVRVPTEGPYHEGVIGNEFSPDGRRLMVSNHAGTASLYDAQTFERDAGFSPILIGGSGVNPAHYSPDGSRIVGLSGDVVDGQWTGGLARIWDARTGKELVVLRRHENVLSAAFVGTGNRVMTAGGSFIRFWDAANGSELVQIRVREGNAGIVQAAASPDGALVASGRSSIRGAVWDTHTGKQVTELNGARKDTWVSQFTPDGRFVVTHDDIGTVAFWDPTTGELARALQGPPAGIESIDMSASGDRLLAGGYDYTVRMWDTLTNKLLFFADLLPHKTEEFPMIPDAGRVHALLRPSVQQALVQLVMPGTSEPGLLFDLPYNTFDEVLNAAYTAVPYRFTEDERAELELDLFGRPDPRSADLEVLTQPPPG